MLKVRFPLFAVICAVGSIGYSGLSRHLRCGVPELTQRGTIPPFAGAAIADAAFPRRCSDPHFAAQRISPNQPFKRSIAR